VPGNASGGMDGIALKPLTVSFSEPGFVSKLNQENQFGPWFTLSDKDQQQLGSPMGPQNPQVLNRYSYGLNNPIRNTDPSGHAVPPQNCPWCNVNWGNIGNWNDTAKGAAIVGCFITGCHINTSTGEVTGPTTTEVLSAALSGMMPVGLVGVRGFGNVGGGKLTVEKALGLAEKWLGPGYKEIAEGVYRSADNLRQFRMTTDDLLDPRQGSHVHFESIDANGRDIVENSHVELTNP